MACDFHLYPTLPSSKKLKVVHCPVLPFYSHEIPERDVRVNYGDWLNINEQTS